MEKRICELTDEFLANEKNKHLDIKLIILGYNQLSKGQALITKGLRKYNKIGDSVKSWMMVTRGLRLYSRGRENVNKGILKILEQRI